MNPFVNPNKRSILLPPGCKDLGDVLHPQKRKKIADLQFSGASKAIGALKAIPTICPVRFERAGLSHVSAYVAALKASRSLEASVHIRSLDGLLGVSLYRFASEFTILPIPEAVERTRQIEEFFAKRGIQANFDRVVAGGDTGSLQILMFPLPADVSAAAQLTADVLRDVYSIDDETGLEFTGVNLKLK